MILRPIDAGTFVEESMPVELEDDSVTILFARGSTHLAATRTIQELLPVAKTARNAVVIARLRGAEQIGSTFITVLERYATELRANGGRLMLSGVHPKVKDQLLRTETTEDIPEEIIFMATPILSESTRAALAAAQEWLTREDPD